MKVKNNTNKPIGIGTLNLLPGKTEILPAPYENHPLVKMLAAKRYDDEHKFITLIADKKAAKAPEGDNGGAEDYTLEKLGKMKREELEAIATELGVATEGLTNKTMLAEAIIAAKGAETGSEE